LIKKTQLDSNIKARRNGGKPKGNRLLKMNRLQGVTYTPRKRKTTSLGKWEKCNSTRGLPKEAIGGPAAGDGENTLKEIGGASPIIPGKFQTNNPERTGRVS